MSPRRAIALLLGLLACGAGASGLQELPSPRLSYAYPAGGQQGSVVQVFLGGQMLAGAKDVLVSGEGVRATNVRYLGRTLRLNGAERREVLRRLKGEPLKEGEEAAKLPKHPLLDRLAELSPLELDFLKNGMLKPDDKRQPNAQLGETVLVELTLDPDAAPGDRELRLLAAQGLTDPLVFQVGRLPELLEPQPYDAGAEPAPAADLPVTFGGQIKPGDVDRFGFRARAGQRVVIRVHARGLIPFLADAVPGWFQPVLAVYDAQGRELAFADDYRFDPDPVLCLLVPATGEYQLEIRDALYRGREDFVYRIELGERPFIQSIFPLGGRAGEETRATLGGWNLRRTQLALDTRPEGPRIRTAALEQGEWFSNRVTYAVDTLPERFERETNDSPELAQRVEPPLVVNGRIGRAGDSDVFRFEARAGEEIVAEVLARQLLSPLDSLLQLCDASGRILFWNDDLERKEGDLRTQVGVLTHHADSYLRWTTPHAGTYFLRISDAERRGGDEYAYRLRLGAPRPGFSLCVTPSTLNLRSGVATPIEVHVARVDGFDGPVELSLVDAPAGFRLQGALVPAGCDHVRITLTPPPRNPAGPVALAIEGRAQVAGQTVGATAVPCEDSMQAFLWRHLVPSQQLLAFVAGVGTRGPAPEVAGSLPVQIPRGGTAEVLIRTDARVKLDEFECRLEGAPAGLALVKSTPCSEGLKLELRAETEGPVVGSAGNLIVCVYRNQAGALKDGKPGPLRRSAVGFLPAIPFEIVAGKP